MAFFVLILDVCYRRNAAFWTVNFQPPPQPPTQLLSASFHLPPPPPLTHPPSCSCTMLPFHSQFPLSLTSVPRSKSAWHFNHHILGVAHEDKASSRLCRAEGGETRGAGDGGWRTGQSGITADRRLSRRGTDVWERDLAECKGDVRRGEKRSHVQLWRGGF